MNEEDRCLRECVEYFREREVYRKIFAKIREKVIGLGHFGGSVTFASLSQGEKEQLEGFFQKSLRSQKTVTISAVLMQKALENSRFAGLSWERILETYFEEPLIGRAEQERRRREEKEQFFRQFLMASRQGINEVVSKVEEWPEECVEQGMELDNLTEVTPGQAWLLRALEGGSGAGLLAAQYREDREQLHTALTMVMKAAENLPSERQEFETLPVFAAKVTGNPHYFDQGTIGGRLLEAFLTDYCGGEREPGFSEPEWKSRILYGAGLLRDELSNYTMAYGIWGRRKNGVLHNGMKGFFQEKEPVVCTLLTLGTLKDAGGNQDVYVVENPAVFTELMFRYPQASLVCTNGQPRLASLVLLDFLKQHSTLWYAGDFDPEGLLIAQRLKQRYGNALQFWDYRVEYYRKAMSEVLLDEKRLHKLDGVSEPGLVEIAGEIRQTRRAAYQEAMLGWAYQI